MEGLWGGSLAAHAGTCFKLFSHYLALAVFPHPLIADYTGDVFPLSPGFADAPTLLAVLLLAAFAAIAVRVYPSRPLVALGMGWFLTALAPVLQILPKSSGLVLQFTDLRPRSLDLVIQPCLQ